MSEPSSTDTSTRSKPWLMALPLVGFIALAGLFLLRLYGDDPSKIPSALIGRPAPQTALPALEGLVNNGTQVPGLDPALFKGKVSVVNVWASWCVPCHDEAPLLTELARDKRCRSSASITRMRRITPGAFSAATAIRSASSASTAMAAPPSNGASTAYRRPLSWGAKARFSTRWSARSHQRISTVCSRPRSTRRCRREVGARTSGARIHPFVTSPPSASLASSDAGSR